jgi:hypothetical protein
MMKNNNNDNNNNINNNKSAVLEMVEHYIRSNSQTYVGSNGQTLHQLKH